MMNKLPGLAVMIGSLLFAMIGIGQLLGEEPPISWRFVAATSSLAAALWGGLLAREWSRDKRAQMLSALNVMFYKVHALPGYTADEIGRFWVAELGDKNIKVKWDSELGEFT